MRIDLTASELKLLVVLLDKAGDEFARHGCNDFDLLRDGGLTPGEAEELKTRMQAEFSPEEGKAFDRDCQYDWLLIRRYQRLFERALAASTPTGGAVTCQHCGQQFLPEGARYHTCTTN